MYYDKEGKEISVLTWGSLSELEDYKIVKQERVSEYMISTIWKGIDAEEIFETMVFCDDKDDRLHKTKWTSKTIGEALEAHKIAICACVEAMQDDDECDLNQKIDDLSQRIDDCNTRLDKQNDINKLLASKIVKLQEIIYRIENLKV